MFSKSTLKILIICLSLVIIILIIFFSTQKKISKFQILIESIIIKLIMK